MPCGRNTPRSQRLFLLLLVLAWLHRTLEVRSAGHGPHSVAEPPLGTTIHAWGAITPGVHDIGKLVSYIKTCRPAHQRWKTTKVLVIDEVSMVDGQLFDTLAKLAVELRKKTDRPFGGIQVCDDLAYCPHSSPLD